MATLEQRVASLEQAVWNTAVRQVQLIAQVNALSERLDAVQLVPGPPGVDGVDGEPGLPGADGAPGAL